MGPRSIRRRTRGFCSEPALSGDQIGGLTDWDYEGRPIAYTEHTLWLTPGEPLRSRLRSIIVDLAARLDAVEFEPHVTVFCGPTNDAAARDLVRRIARETPPCELIAERLDHTGSFTKTLFVQFQELAAVRRIFETARAGSPPSNYVLNPHLSLLYKTLPAVTRQELSRTTDAPRGRYAFERIAMIETELPIEEDGPVRRWRKVCDEALAGR